MIDYANVYFAVHIVKTHHTVYFKWVNFLACKVCINKVNPKSGGEDLRENLRCWVHLRCVCTWRCSRVRDEGGALLPIWIQDVMRQRQQSLPLPPHISGPSPQGCHAEVSRPEALPPGPLQQRRGTFHHHSAGPAAQPRTLTSLSGQ